MPFTKAVKISAKLRLAIAGPSGSGKTYTALRIATALGGPVALVDTEHGSASKYADLFAFDVLEMQPPFHPDRFVEAIAEAARSGYNVVILDSLTHAWQGTGGLLDLVDEIAKRKAGGGTPNTFAAWKDATPIQNRLVDAIVGAGIHIIACIRSKQDYTTDKDDKGRTVIRKVGMAPQQREGFEYEFDVFGEMDIENNMVITKTRCPALNGRVFAKPGEDVASILSIWLQGNGHEPPSPTPKHSESPPADGDLESIPAAQDERKITDQQRKHMFALANDVYGRDRLDEFRQWIHANYRVESTNNLTMRQGQEIIELLKRESAPHGGAA